MPNTIHPTSADDIRKQISQMIGMCDPTQANLADALQSVLVAMEYRDPVLIRSHLNGVFESIKSVVEKNISEKSGVARSLKENCQMIFGTIEAQPFEDWDDIGNQLKSIFIMILTPLVEMHDQIIRMLQNKGYEIENGPLLEREIHELKELENEIFQDWPWSNRPLPSVNRKMVAESKGAFARGECLSIQQIIQ